MNHKYVDIKSQKISPEGKAKIQLQIVMHDGACTTFHFNNPVGGADAQKKERDDVKELLQQLLPTFKKKVNKELEEKNRMLSENPGLLQVHKIQPSTWGLLYSLCGGILPGKTPQIAIYSFLSEMLPQKLQRTSGYFPVKLLTVHIVSMLKMSTYILQ